MLTNSAMTAAVEAHVVALVKRFEDKVGFAAPVPNIMYSLRGRTAGKCFYTQNRLDFNMVLLNENFEKFMATTVPHEVAHHLDYQYHGGLDRSANGRRRPHGLRWKTIMNMLGANPKRCHTYDVSNVGSNRRQTFAYECGCQTYDLTITRHRRILKGTVYKCNKCGTRLNKK